MKPSTSSLYSVYGLCVRSELQLDGVPEGRGEADVIIRRGEVQARAQHPVQAGCFEADAQRIFIYQPGAGFLLAQAGRELIVEVPPDHDAYFMQSVVLGRGLAAVLHQRDVLTLHAGAVADGEAALAFIGERGDGKSTTTSALVRHGCRLVTDDLLPIRVGADSAPRVYTGGAQVKLWPASLATASDDAAAHPRVSDAVDKRYWAADAPFEAAEAPLRAVYELAFGKRLRGRAVRGACRVCRPQPARLYRRPRARHGSGTEPHDARRRSRPTRARFSARPPARPQPARCLRRFRPRARRTSLNTNGLSRCLHGVWVRRFTPRIRHACAPTRPAIAGVND